MLYARREEIAVGPATLTVMLMVALLLLGGAFVLVGVRKRRTRRACPSCGHRNAADAAYCGQCGRQL